MKTLLLSLLLLPSLGFSYAPPPSPCGGVSCTPRMREIATGFAAAGGIEQASLPLLASGECYHLDQFLSPETTHHGVTLLDLKDGQAYMGGSYGFFHPENPYKNWDLAKARESSSNLYADNHRVELAPELAFADMNPGGKDIWQYWVKRSGQKLFVMGHWGVFHRILCELNLHQAPKE
jgi:hypothetical protein